MGPDASADDVRRARNLLAKQYHPDVGGSADRMQRVNEAAAAALARIGEPVPPTSAPSASAPAGREPRRARSQPPRQPPTRHRVGRDHPSFTIEALPVDAFEALVIVAGVLGDIADDEPPYRLDMVFAEQPPVWCRIELVPDGGGSTASLTVASPEPTPAAPPPLDVFDVRDRIVAELNALEWASDGPRR